MARENLTRFTCDRCKKTIEEVAYAENAGGATKPKVYIESIGVGHDEPIRFDDLCKSCQDRCTALFAQITLEKDDKDSKGDTNTSTDANNKDDKGKGGSK